MDLPDRAPHGSEQWIVSILSLAFVGLMGMGLMEDYEPRKLAVVLVLLFWAPLLVIHEAGHAVVARLCGWEVDRIVLGFGRTRWRLVVAGIPVEIKTLPLSGFVLPRPRDLQSPRLKNALIYAGGPGFELLAALLVIGLTGPSTFFQPSESLPVIAAQAFGLAAAMGLVFTLFPYRISEGRGESWSDGMGILASWKLPDPWFAMRITNPKFGDDDDDEESEEAGAPDKRSGRSRL